MNRELKRILDRNERFRSEAVSATVDVFRDIARVGFSVTDWSRSVEEIYKHQWCTVKRHSDGGWDWPEIRRRFRDPDDHFLAVRAGERLSALALIRASNFAVTLHRLEGDPRADCPLKGVRAAIALDIAAFYGQKRGCVELRLEPVNSSLRELYVKGYGFEEIAPKKGTPYLKKDL